MFVLVYKTGQFFLISRVLSFLEQGEGDHIQLLKIWPSANKIQKLNTTVVNSVNVNCPNVFFAYLKCTIKHFSKNLYERTSSRRSNWIGTVLSILENCKQSERLTEFHGGRMMTQVSNRDFLWYIEQSRKPPLGQVSRVKDWK